MSYSIGSAESSVYSSASSVAESAKSYETRHEKKWWYAAKWSAAFCDGVEERLTCGTERWVGDDQEIDEVTIIEEPADDKKDKKVEKNKASYSFLAKYHTSKTSKNDKKSGEKKEKDILNQLIQGNHRGWGPMKSLSKKSSSKDRSNDILKENILLSYGSTFDDTVDESQIYSVTDGESFDDTYDRTLESASTYDSSYDGTYDSAPDDEDESFNETKDKGKRLSQSSARSVSNGRYTSRSNRSSFSTTSSADRSSRISDASRNDTARHSSRENKSFERESPSFESRTSRQLKKNHNRSFGSQPSTDSSSQRSTFEKSSFVTPQKMLSTYQTASEVKQKSRSEATRQTRKSHRGSNKKIELGRRRATERMIKEQAKAKPKAFPYIVNHSLFHQNLANKQARTLGQRTNVQ